MGAAHTYFENVKNLSLLTPSSITASFTSASMDTTLSRANAILVDIGIQVFSVVNFWTFNLEESDDNSTFTTVVNGANLGEEINTIWSSMTDNLELLSSTDPQTALVGANLVLDTVGNDQKIYVAEYKGTKPFIRLNAVEAGTLATILSVTSGQNALLRVPNIVDIGDNN